LEKAPKGATCEPISLTVKVFSLFMLSGVVINEATNGHNLLRTCYPCQGAVISERPNLLSRFTIKCRYDGRKSCLRRFCTLVNHYYEKTRGEVLKYLFRAFRCGVVNSFSCSSIKRAFVVLFAYVTPSILMCGIFAIIGANSTPFGDLRRKAVGLSQRQDQHVEVQFMLRVSFSFQTSSSWPGLERMSFR
jgi:hypothetical protein